MGWSESYNSGYDSGYGDDEFEYDEFVEREFPSHAKRSWKWSIKRIVMIVVVALLVIALLRPFLWW